MADCKANKYLGAQQTCRRRELVQKKIIDIYGLWIKLIATEVK